MDNKKTYTIVSVSGAKIREVRKEAGLTLGALASMVYVARSTIGHYEQEIRDPNKFMVGKIAKALKKPVAYFYDLRSVEYE